MSNITSPLETAPLPGPDMSKAIRDARLAQANHASLVNELRTSELARLEQLSEDIKALLTQVPPEHRHLFDGGLIPGFPPRVWIDVLTYVEMGRDRRMFRLVRDGRNGTVTLRESVRPADILERVIEYVAQRVVDRERAFAEDRGVPLDKPAPKALPHDKLPPLADSMRLLVSKNEKTGVARRLLARTRGGTRASRALVTGLSAALSGLFILGMMAAVLVTLGIAQL